jgi:hypothetical protein
MLTNTVVKIIGERQGDAISFFIVTLSLSLCMSVYISRREAEMGVNSLASKR